MSSVVVLRVKVCGAVWNKQEKESTRIMLNTENGSNKPEMSWWRTCADIYVFTDHEIWTLEIRDSKKAVFLAKYVACYSGFSSWREG